MVEFTPVMKDAGNQIQLDSRPCIRSDYKRPIDVFKEVAIAGAPASSRMKVFAVNQLLLTSR